MADNLPNEISNKDIQSFEAHAKMVEKLSALEQQKITLETQKLEFAKQQDANSYSYALKALEIK